MTQAQSAPPENDTVNWPETVGEKLKSDGAWKTLSWLQTMRQEHPTDLALRGYVEILRASIVRDLLALTSGFKSMPRMSPDFLTEFDKFNLTAQEGYLISLIDGNTNLEKLLKLSPFDPFTTFFSLARMQNLGAIEIPE